MSKLNTIFIGKVLYRLAVVNSTNAFAIELLSKSNPSEGTVISATEQQQGRGQIGSSWHSSPGQNLTMSVILFPKFILPRQQFYLNMAVSLAAAATVQHFISDTVWVKWSNDIYVKNRKVAGILIQNGLSGQDWQYSVVGIGLNVNEVNFPATLPNPTSIALETGFQQELEQVEQTFCWFLEQWYLRLKNGEFNAIRNAYLDKLFLLEQRAHFRLPNGDLLEGKITGIDENGKLLIEHNNRKHAFGIKEIEFVL